MNKQNNTGVENTGDYNSGDRNSGYRNSGDRNSGNCNSGDYNSGYYNSGNCNSGYYNSGWFNTNEPKMRMFNKDTDMTYTKFCDRFNVIYPDLKVCAWIYDKDMTDKEKKEIEDWSKMGGYLKTLTYKEAWAEWWGRATKEQKDFFLNLPTAMVVADSAEPKSIDEIRSYGVSILPSVKGQGSVLQGIQKVQDQRISVTKRSLNLLKEYRNYLWETDKEGKIINEPEKGFDHCMDAIRYAINSLTPDQDDDYSPAVKGDFRIGL